MDQFIPMLRFPEDEGLNWVEKGIHVEIFLRIYLFHMYEHFPSGFGRDRFDYKFFEPKSNTDKDFIIRFLTRALEKFHEDVHLKIIDKFYFTDQNYKQLNVESPAVLLPQMIDYFRSLRITELN